MSAFILTCPVCNFSKQVEVAVVPRPGTTVTCPVCKSMFPFESDEPAAAPGTDEAPFAGEAGEAGEATAPVSPPPRKEARRTLAFDFTGSAREYFGIWIVNTFLRIVTLGLYSPWAKVRKRRYFYGNTLLDGVPFDFLGDPWAILKGWFLAGLFFTLYSFASRVSPLVSALLMLFFLGVFPWVVVRSRIFNLRNTSHRNIRFGFNADYAEAYRVFLWWQLLLPLTMGVLVPYIYYRQRRFLVENSRYGTTPFRFHATPGQYFRIFLPMVILFPVAFAAAIGAILVKPNALTVALPAVFFTGVYLCAALYVRTALTNLTWSSTSLGDHRFTCALRMRDLIWIYLSNAVAVICTLGLLAPWATVRLLRYRLERLSAAGAGGLDAIRASKETQVGAAPEELGDMLGFDLGL
ncbi:YjgN family protein [Geomonas subterranea]|uniref:YjgN family protein n=1 Tax=Geomonas subterranea TaxID=2847989 RepID=UPI001CD68286|nr:YjgN family protein [Geomonas fuzhouensis]